MALKELSQSPAFFPFKLPILTGEIVRQFTPRIEVIKGVDDEFLRLI
ncbi:MAG: hypothetical protein HQM13_11035 [SAR324 cluster bacterium]|nr:hypothetical protein [SAR324 cluster bacterium]